MEIDIFPLFLVKNVGRFLHHSEFDFKQKKRALKFKALRISIYNSYVQPNLFVSLQKFYDLENFLLSLRNIFLFFFRTEINVFAVQDRTRTQHT